MLSGNPSRALPSVPQTWSVTEDVCPYHGLEMIPYVKDPHPHKHGQNAPKIELGIYWVCTQVKNGLNFVVWREFKNYYYSFKSPMILNS